MQTEIRLIDFDFVLMLLMREVRGDKEAAVTQTTTHRRHTTHHHRKLLEAGIEPTTSQGVDDLLCPAEPLLDF